MHVCFIDESGDSGSFNNGDPNANPFFIICGLIIDAQSIHSLTIDFLKARERFFPNHFQSCANFLDQILVEIKGQDLRKFIRAGNQRQRRLAFGFIDRCIKLLLSYRVKLLGVAIIKNFDAKYNDSIFYGSSIQYIATHFNHFLQCHDECGVIVADGRRKAQNKITTHSVFTQLHKHNGSAFPAIHLDIVFSHSNNSALIQLADIVCSGVVFPMVADAYNLHLFDFPNVHNSPAYFHMRMRYMEEIKKMQYRYSEGEYMAGGLSVRDFTHLKRKSNLLFKSLQLPALRESDHENVQMQDL